MLKPEGVANVLQSKLFAVAVERGYNAEKRRCAYHLDFEEYMTLDMLQERVDAAERVVEIDLIVTKIEPVLHLDDERVVESRLRVTVEETKNRNEIENHNLAEFTLQK